MMQVPSHTLLSLQLIRFLAALLVVFVHINASYSTGHFGVDLFFVLSGYVIAMIIARGEKPIDFLKKRIIRIVPLYWLITIFIGFIVFVKPDIMPKVIFKFEYLIKSLFFIPFFNSNGGIYPLYFIGWTLNYEMFFYAFAFICIVFSPKKNISSLMLIVLLVSIVAFLQFVESNNAVWLFLKNSIYLEFIFGIFAYYFTQKFSIRFKHKNLFLLSIILLMFVLLIYFSQWEELYNTRALFRFIVFGLPCFIIIVAALMCEDYFQKLSEKVKYIIFHLGEACYAIYLTHVFVLGILTKFIDPTVPFINSKQFFGTLMALVLCVIVGVVTHNFIEKPMMGYLRSSLLSKR